MPEDSADRIVKDEKRASKTAGRTLEGLRIVQMSGDGHVKEN